MEARSKGGNVVMKTGGFVFGGDVDGVPGGGENGGFGGDGQYGYYDG